MLVQPTSPFVTESVMRDAFSLLRTGEYDSIVSVCENFTFNWAKDGKPLNFDTRRRPRTQDAIPWYEENGAVYGTSAELFLRTKVLWSGKVGLVCMPKSMSIDIDNHDDLKIAAALISAKE